MRDGKAHLIPIELDRERRLCFDFNALAAYEEATGTSVLAEGLQDGLRTARGIRALLWAALLHEDPDLTLSDVGAMLNIGNMADLTARLQAALVSALPAPDPEGNADAAGPSRRGGRISGR